MFWGQWQHPLRWGGMTQVSCLWQHTGAMSQQMLINVITTGFSSSASFHHLLLPKKYQFQCFAKMSLHTHIVLLNTSCWLVLLTYVVSCYSFLLLSPLNARLSRFLSFAVCTSIKLNHMKLLTSHHFQLARIAISPPSLWLLTGMEHSLAQGLANLCRKWPL